MEEEQNTEIQDKESEVEQPAPKRRTKKAKSEQPVETPPDMLPLTVGMVLQQARNQKHMKLPSISKKLCIKEIYLEALEQGKYDAFPALVYGIGFLRSYASFLGLDPDEMSARFHRETTEVQPETLDMPRTNDPKVMPSPKLIIKTIIIFALLYLIWVIYKTVSYNPFPQLQLPVVPHPVQVEETNMPAPLTADELMIPQEAQNEPTAEDVTTKREGIIYGLKKPARVSFVATDTVRVEIRDTDANSILFQKTLQPGDCYNPIEDAQGLVMETTNAGGLDVYIDGKKVRTLGTKGEGKAGIPLTASALLKG